MDGHSFLTRVVLENYKSIAACDVRLQPLTFLVGPNGSGKSNFLDALRFVADSLKHSVGQALKSRGGGPAIRHAPNKQQARFGIHLEFVDPGGRVGHYTVRIGRPQDASGQGKWEVLEETIGLPAVEGDTGTGLRSRPEPRHRDFFSDRSALALVADDPAYSAVYQSLTRMLFYNIQPRAVEDVADFEPGQFLPPDGSNLASILFRLGMPGEVVRDRINDYMRLILPGLIKVRAEPVLPEENTPSFGRQKVALRFEQRAGKGVHLFWPSQMSDGTLRALGNLTALLQGNVESGPRPSLVALEEPEAQVHPAVNRVLLDAMTEASYNTQVLVATHSADLLDHKDIDPASILVVDAEDGVTHIGPISEVDRSVIRDRLYTPGELMRQSRLFPAKGSENGDTTKPSSKAPHGGIG